MVPATVKIGEVDTMIVNESHRHRAPRTDAQERLAPALRRAFPLPPSGSFASLLEAIDEAEETAARR